VNLLLHPAIPTPVARVAKISRRLFRCSTTITAESRYAQVVL
jgi:hypothetical protein